MHGGHMMGMGFGLGFLNLIGTVLFWVALIWAIRFFVRGGFRGGRFNRDRYAKWRGYMKHAGGRGDWGRGRGNSGGRPWEQDEADKLIRERLAKGEIGEDEYARLKAQLGGDSGGTGNSGGSTNGGPNEGRSEGGPLSWLRGDNALETARLRLAKGEITPDEFETIRRVLAS